MNKKVINKTDRTSFDILIDLYSEYPPVVQTLKKIMKNWEKAQKIENNDLDIENITVANNLTNTSSKIIVIIILVKTNNQLVKIVFLIIFLFKV